MIRLLPIFSIFYPDVSYVVDITQMARDFSKYTSMWGARVCSCLSNQPPPIAIFSLRPTMLQVVIFRTMDDLPIPIYPVLQPHLCGFH